MELNCKNRTVLEAESGDGAVIEVNMGNMTPTFEDRVCIDGKAVVL